MKLKQLLNVKHDKDFVKLLIERCNRSIESCKTSEQVETCIKYIEFAKRMLWAKEYIDEYTPFKLRMIHLLTKDTYHKDFCVWIKSEFNKIYDTALNKKDSLKLI